MLRPRSRIWASGFAASPWGCLEFQWMSVHTHSRGQCPWARRPLPSALPAAAGCLASEVPHAPSGGSSGVLTGHLTQEEAWPRDTGRFVSLLPPPVPPSLPGSWWLRARSGSGRLCQSCFLCPYLKVCGCFPFTDSARPVNPPFPQGIGCSHLGPAVATVGSQKDQGWRGLLGCTPAAVGPVLEVPLAGPCRQLPSAWHYPVLCPSCQRRVGAIPRSQCWGAPAYRERDGGEGVELGAGHAGNIFVTAVVGANESGVTLSYCCQRDVKFIVALQRDLFCVLFEA